jgi:hypothetical protein
MSTYLHETVHWWQHIGSTYGFILSLNYPVQSHCTHFDLKRLVEHDGFKKQLWLILGDGVNQAADFASGATSIPSWNLTRWMTFGNWF